MSKLLCNLSKISGGANAPLVAPLTSTTFHPNTFIGGNNSRARYFQFACFNLLAAKGCGAVVKMIQLRLRSSFFHEHGSSSGAHGFHVCGSCSEAVAILELKKWGSHYGDKEKCMGANINASPQWRTRRGGGRPPGLKNSEQTLFSGQAQVAQKS